LSVTAKLAEFVAGFEPGKIPAEVARRARMCILDWLGSALVGSREPSASILWNLVRGMEGKRESVVIGRRSRMPCLTAALVNGVAGHAAELDDVHEKSVIHPGAPVLPAALAAAERFDAAGDDFLAGVVLGYEVELRVGSAMMPSHYRFWHPTGTCGTFGATAAAGFIAGLDQERMINALGIAGTQASGLIETFGTMAKPLNPGKAAMSGLLSVLLAREGYTGPTSILDGEKSFIKATSESRRLDEVTEDLGCDFAIMNSVVKVHASCGHTHGAIDAVLNIVAEGRLEPKDIQEIVVGTYPIAVEVVGKNYDSKTPEEAKFSLPYCVARAALDGRVGLDQFSEEKLRDPVVAQLIRRVKVQVEPDFAKVRLGGARVTVRTRSGEELSSRVDVPRGYPQNPLSGEELKSKFEGLATTVLPKTRVSKILRAVDRLEEWSLRDFARLLLG